MANKMWSQSKDVWPSSFLAQSLQGRACASLVSKKKKKKKPQWDQRNFKSNTINGEVSTNVHGGQGKKSFQWWNVWPAAQMQRLMMTLDKTVNISLKYRHYCTVNWLDFDLYREQTWALPPEWEEHLQFSSIGNHPQQYVFLPYCLTF